MTSHSWLARDKRCAPSHLSTCLNPLKSGMVLKSARHTTKQGEFSVNISRLLSRPGSYRCLKVGLDNFNKIAQLQQPASSVQSAALESPRVITLAPDARNGRRFRRLSPAHIAVLQIPHRRVVVPVSRLAVTAAAGREADDVVAGIDDDANFLRPEHPLRAV